MNLKLEKWKAIGTLIRSARVKKNLSQIEVARHMGMDNSQFISLIESGKSALPLNYVKPLCEFLDVSPSRIKKIHKYYFGKMYDQAVNSELMIE